MTLGAVNIVFTLWWNSLWVVLGARLLVEYDKAPQHQMKGISYDDSRMQYIRRQEMLSLP